MKVKIVNDFAKARRAAERMTIRSLGHAAGAIRLTARRSIRRSQKASQPGSPPNTRGKAGKSVKTALRYELDRGRQQAVIGPIASEVGQSMAAHEFGKTYRGQKFPKRPTMAPALEKNRQKLTSFWAASLVQE